MSQNEAKKRIGDAAAIAAALSLARPRRNPPPRVAAVVQAATAKAAIITGYSRDEIQEAGIDPEILSKVEQTLSPTTRHYFDFIVQTLQPLLLGQVSLSDRIDSDFFANPENVAKILRVVEAFGITPEDLAKRRTAKATAARDLCAYYARLLGAPQNSFFRHFGINEKYLRISPELKIKKVYGEDLHQFIHSELYNKPTPEKHRLQMLAQCMLSKKAENRKNGPRVALRFVT